MAEDLNVPSIALDATYFPHIFDNILDHCSYPALLKLRLLSPETSRKIDSRLFSAVELRIVFERKQTYYLSNPPLVLQHPQGYMLPGPPEISPLWETRLASTRLFRFDISNVNSAWHRGLTNRWAITTYLLNPACSCIRSGVSISVPIKRCNTVIDMFGGDHADEWGRSKQVKIPQEVTTHVAVLSGPSTVLDIMPDVLVNDDYARGFPTDFVFIANLDPKSPDGPTPPRSFGCLPADLRKDPLARIVNMIVDVGYSGTYTLVGFDDLLVDFGYEYDPQFSHMHAPFAAALRARCEAMGFSTATPACEFLTKSHYEARVGASTFELYTGKRTPFSDEMTDAERKATLEEVLYAF